MMNEHAMNIAEVKKRFSELLDKVAYGKEQILITKSGRPMARLIPADHSERHPGDVEGWLDEDDPFFTDINHRAASRDVDNDSLIERKHQWH
jgi:prevent-host-death family protein